MDRGALAVLTVACLEVSDYLGRGIEYVQRLRRAVAAHLSVPHRFVVCSDRGHAGVERLEPMGALPGWWQKHSLFAPGRFPKGWVLYLDLDTVILGDLTPLAGYRGEYAILRDVWTPSIGQGAVILWRSGFGAHIWEAAIRAPRNPRQRADYQLAALTPGREYLQDLYPGLFRSYKAEALEGPGDAAVVYLHGRPRPHEATGWVADAWRLAA